MSVTTRSGNSITAKQIISTLKSTKIDTSRMGRRSMRSGDRTLYPIFGDEANNALVDLMLDWQHGPVGNCFLTNQKASWDGDRVLTLYVQGRAVAELDLGRSWAIAYRVKMAAIAEDGPEDGLDRNDDAIDMRRELKNGAGAWLRAFRRVAARDYDTTYKARLAEAKRHLARVARGSMTGVPDDFRYDPGQCGGTWSWTPTGETGRVYVSTRSVGHIAIGTWDGSWDGEQMGYSAREAVDRIIERREEEAAMARVKKMEDIGLRELVAFEKGRRHLIAGRWYVGRTHQVGDKTPLGNVLAVAVA